LSCTKMDLPPNAASNPIAVVIAGSRTLLMAPSYAAVSALL
jgi:hypothetical protein